MRTALLSAQKRTSEGGLRADLTLCGRSVLGWQIDLVAELGCERVICLSETASPEILLQQHACEAQGLDFHAIRGSLQLVSLMTADDLLLMVMDGLVVETGAASRAIGSHNTIASFPKETAACAESRDDFELLDGTQCWAGIAKLSGREVSKLAELPPDSDTFSTLLRLGLQARTRIEELDPAMIDDGDWVLAKEASDLRETERNLVAKNVPAIRMSGPMLAATGLTISKIAPIGLQGGGPVAAVSGLVLLVGASILGWFGLGVAALVCAAIGALAVAFGDALIDLKSRIFKASETSKYWQYINAIRDALVALLLVFLAPAFEPAIMVVLTVGMIRLAERSPHAGLRTFWTDRPLQLALLAIGAVVGGLWLLIAALGLLAMGQNLLQNRKNKITRD
ncbi:MAG: hypothetical protein AAGK02_04205 [Pseudomonadota bacterium]